MRGRHFYIFFLEEAKVAVMPFMTPSSSSSALLSFFFPSKCPELRFPFAITPVSYRYSTYLVDISQIYSWNSLVEGDEGSYSHRLLLLKLDKQIGGTIYHQLFLAMNKPQAWRGWGTVHKPRWMQISTIRWLRGCLSSFNNRCLWYSTYPEITVYSLSSVVEGDEGSYLHKQYEATSPFSCCATWHTQRERGCSSANSYMRWFNIN